MKDKLAIVTVVALCVAATLDDAPVQAQSTSPSAPTQRGAPPPAPGRSDAQIAPHKWNVERVRCSDLLAAADDDRASAVMFYYGYLAAKANIHIIDVSKISDNIAKVMKQCSSTPAATVPEAFREALGPS